MSARRCFNVSLGHLKSSPLALGRASVTPKTGLHITCLQQQISWQIAWKPSHLRAFGTSSQRVYQALGQINKRILSGLVSGLVKGRDIGLQIRDSNPPKKMKDFLSEAVSYLSKTPKSIMASAFTGVCAFSLHNFYSEHKVKLPLNERKAFILQTEEEALDNSEVQAKLLLNEIMCGPNESPSGPTTTRLKAIMERLLDANPELNQHLMPGGEWRIMVKKHNQHMDWIIARAFDCGMMVFAADVMQQLDDDEIAFMMAHEMTHAVMKHENETWSTNTFFFHYFNNIMKPVRETLGGGKDIRNYLIDFAQGLKKYGFTFTDIRAQEREADEFGFIFATKACFDYRKFGPSLRKIVEILGGDIYHEEKVNREIAYSPLDDRFSERDWVMFTLQASDYWSRNIYDPPVERWCRLDSNWNLADNLRKKAKCPTLPGDPVIAVKVLSQKVDEITAAWKATLQSQGEPVLQSQVEPVLQRQQEPVLQRQQGPASARN